MKPKIVCLVDQYLDSRVPLIMAEGLLDLDANVSFNQNVWSLGTKIAEVESPEKLKQDLLDCDLIFMPDYEHFGGKTEENMAKHRAYHGAVVPSLEWLNYLNEKDLWSKVIVYDTAHEVVFPDLVDKCLAYFKREHLLWTPVGIFGRFVERNDERIHPFPLCVLSCYEEMCKRMSSTKNIDVGYFFTPEILAMHGAHYNRRMQVMSYLHGADWSKYAVQLKIEHNYLQTCYHDPASFPPEDDLDYALLRVFQDYYKLLSNTKIIIDALPTRYTQTHRPWEALASGNLCVLDYEPQEKLEYPFEDGKHCLLYNATDATSILEMIERVKYYVRHDTERERIAESGFEHAKKYHRASNRVKYMLEVVDFE